jgi:bifunctional DNA-binding transcriptional regulator/antitoxin component of YhaV-PrlF toxin-antitoxin module
MTAKGQIVIPFDIRKETNVGEGTVFAVFGSGDTIMLKKVYKPTKEEMKKQWLALAEKTNKKKLNLGEEDVSKLIHRRRGVRDD